MNGNESKGLDRRAFLKGVGLTAASVAFPRLARAAAGASGGPRTRPNFILCMTDDQGWADVSYNGLTKIRTANLDAMAANGLRFDRFYASSPVCSPTRGSCMTGRHPFRYGTTSPGRPLKRQEMTIAQALKPAGYATAHFGKWHLNGVSGPGKPVPADDPLSPGQFGFDMWFSVSNYFECNWTFSRMGTKVATQGDGSDVIVAETLKWIDQVRSAKADQPFLAVVWFGNPHTPCAPLPEDLQAAGGDAFYGEILGVDRAMGTLRDGLRKRGLADNTMLWFNSDNGRPGPNGILKGKKGQITEGGVRVPGICEWPARVKPGRTSVQVVTSDFYPTILDAAGVAMPANQVRPLDGISVLPLLEGKMTERPSPIGFMHGKACALSDNRYKLMEAGSAVELYDLVADPGEQNDLAAQKPEIVAKMKPILDQWKASVDKSKRGEDYRA